MQMQEKNSPKASDCNEGVSFSKDRFPDLHMEQHGSMNWELGCFKVNESS